MKVINARNVHHALWQAIPIILTEGKPRSSRNGNVLVHPMPVTTVYDFPQERVLFWSQRDANPFFHLYESLWMLAGRNDVAGPARYAKQMLEYSDDGTTVHGAYGHRWRGGNHVDQLGIIAERLTLLPEDRRSILQMWDAELDLHNPGKDVPCNLIVTFQLNAEKTLDMSVFCRSNDIIWGAYGANAVHFSVLLEYMATWIGVPIGRYYQVSINWHAYANKLLERVSAIGEQPPFCPYQDGLVRHIPLCENYGPDAIQRFDELSKELLMHADSGFTLPRTFIGQDDPFFSNAYIMLRAHEAWRKLDGVTRFSEAGHILAMGDQTCDWIRASQEWIVRRLAKFSADHQ